LAASIFGQGNAGIVIVNASKEVYVDNSTVFSSVGAVNNNQNNLAVGNGGNIQITTEQLLLSNNAQLATSTFGLGNAGNVNIKARSIQLNNQASIQATTNYAGNGGNINLNIQDLLFFAGNSLISTSTGIASADGNSPNIITVNAPNGFISNFTGAAGTGGNAGNININAASGFICLLMVILEILKILQFQLIL